MHLVTVSKSYLTNKVLSKYFSLNELNSLHPNNSSKQSDEKLLGRIALKHSFTNNNFHKIIIDYSNTGAPVIEQAPKLFCSISHSDDLAVAVSALFKIGIDIEVIRPHDASLLEFIACPEELKLFNISDADALVTYVWVIKEAVSKALGVGIAYPFKDMIIKKENDCYIVEAGGIKWFAKALFYNNHVIGICYPAYKRNKSVLEIKHIL